MAIAMETAHEDVRIKTVLGRLELIIDNENQRLGADPDFDLKTSNTHKSRCLYELTMLCKDVSLHDMPVSFVNQLRGLKQKLAVNARKLEAHVEAVRSVTEILKNAAREADADGTYTVDQFRYGDF